MVKSHDLADHSNTGHLDHKQVFLSLVFRTLLEYRTIWQPDTNLPFNYQTSPALRWLLYLTSPLFRSPLYYLLHLGSEYQTFLLPNNWNSFILHFRQKSLSTISQSQCAVFSTGPCSIWTISIHMGHKEESQKCNIFQLLYWNVKWDWIIIWNGYWNYT